MKLIRTFFLLVAVGGIAYSIGVQHERERYSEINYNTSQFALSFGYICGAFRDPACLNDYKQ